MKYTNINILNNTGYAYPYAVGIDTPGKVEVYRPLSGERSNPLKYSVIDDYNRVILFRDNNYKEFAGIRNENDFVKYSFDDTESTALNVGLESYKVCKVRLFWPEDSVDIYDSTEYFFEVNIRIGDTKILLESCIINRTNNALAIPDGIKRIFDSNYVECTDFTIPDPWSIVYDDEWDDFRKQVCHEAEGSNDTPAQVTFSLIPVVPTTIDPENNEFLMTQGYTGSSNSVTISGKENHLQMYIHSNIGSEDYDGQPVIIAEARYNGVYDNLIEYLQETYLIPTPYVKYEVVLVKDKELAYVMRDGEAVPMRFVSDYTQDDIIECTGFVFDGWEEYEEGLQIMGMIRVYDSNEYIESNDNEDYSLFSIRSNNIPITMELFKYMTTNNGDHRIYNINELEMNNITILNKTVNNVIKYDRTGDSKSNIVQPVFFRAYDLESIVIHPEVTENICINLDIYKSKVDQFQIKIENTSFVEQARLNQGVVFQIQGSRLAKSKTEGTYYILDQDGILVTSGNYVYEM
jgi:hypothetical protein